MQSLLIACLFFGLISIIIPFSVKGEWIYFLLLLVVSVSVFANWGRSDFPLEFPQSEVFECETGLPESTALNTVVSTRVIELTGVAPYSVENDLISEDDGYRLTQINVVLQSGNAKEVQDALEEYFSFQGFRVTGGENVGSGKVVDFLPEE